MRFTVLALIVLQLLASGALAQEDLWQAYNAGDREAALEQALTLLEENPEDRDLNHLAGRALSDLGRNDEARAYLEFCVEGDVRDWRYAWSLFYLAGIDVVEGNDEAAREKWTEVRDSQITKNVARNAAGNLRYFGLDEVYDDWPRRESEHLRVLFSPAHADKDIDRWMKGHELAWDRLTEMFGGGPEYPVRYLVWKDIPEATELCGIQSLGFAKPEYNLVHCLWEQTVGHELAHVVLFHALHPIRTTRFISEGAAVAHDLTNRDRIDTARRAMEGAGVESVDVRLMWNGEHPGADEVLYPVSGAWIWLLIDREGREKFNELATDQTIESAEEIYASDFDALVLEFEGLLND